MTEPTLHLLVSPGFAATYGDAVRVAGAESGTNVELVIVPANPDERLDPAVCEPVRAAYHSHETINALAASFFDAVGKAPNVEWVQSYLAGVDNPVYQQVKDRGVAMVGSVGCNAEPLAASTIGGMLVLARNFVPWILNQQTSAWKSIPAQPDIQGQTMTIFGFGSIGQAVGRVARALGMHVIGVRRSAAAGGDHADEVLHPSRLDEVLPRTDWLVITAPLTDETRGRVDARALSLLPRGARLLNVSRGAIVDQDAMVAALESGQLGGAFLDVFPVEPLPPESPLWKLPNVVISPHGASGSPGNGPRSAAIFIENVRRFARGEDPLHLARG